jgi:zinc/manganese transport system substrate-binding protein
MEADPPHAALFRRNAERLDAELSALDNWVRAEIASIPPAKRSVITSHDAFGYFARAYGVRFVAPVGANTDEEPSAWNMGKLIAQIRAGKTRALFLENMADPKIIALLAHDAHAVIGGTLFSDALSAPSGPAPTYQEMFRHNVTLLVAAMRQNGG